MIGDEQAVDAEHRGEQQRDDQDPGGKVALDRGPLQREVKYDERRDREQRHRRNGLRGAQLEPQLLEDDRADGAHR